jgi:AraC-like DNA-binding protein
MAEAAFEDFIPKINYYVFRKCPQGWRLRPHFVDNYDITYIVQGKARYTIDGIVYELGRGDLLCLTDGMEKEAITYPKNLMHCYSINFSSKYPASKILPPVFPVINHIDMRQDIIDMFRELTMSWTEEQTGFIMKTRALLTLILHRLSEILLFNVDSSSSDYRINKTTRYISVHYSEKLAVKHLADQVHLDADYFARLFKQETGITVHQYITKIRLRNAENMLQSGRFKVHEVAEHCGFSDVVHFYKTFKTIRGFPPSHCMPRDTI